MNIKIFDCCDEIRSEQYKSSIDTIACAAESVIFSNKNSLSQALNEIKIKNTASPLFLLTGQSIASLILNKISDKYPLVLNDLDVFVPYFVSTNDNQSRNVTAEENELNLKYLSNSDNKNQISEVIDSGSRVKIFYENNFNNNQQVALQIIKYKNIYCDHVRNIENVYQKMAFSVLDGFDIDSMKIGLLVNAQIDDITLLIHPDFLNSYKNNSSVATLSVYNPASYLRMFEKNLRLVRKYEEHDPEMKNNDFKYVEKKISTEIQQDIDLMKSSNYIIKKYTNHLDNESLILNSMRVNVVSQPKFFKKLSGLINNLNMLEVLSENPSSALLYKKHYNDIIEDFQNSFKLHGKHLVLDAEKKYECEYIRKMSSKIIKKETTLYASQIAQLIKNELFIVEKKKYNQFLDKIAESSSTISVEAMILYSKWFDELIEKYDMELLLDTYILISSQPPAVYNQIFNFYYSKKAFFNLIDNFSFDNVAELIKKKYLFFIKNPSKQTILKYIETGTALLVDLYYNNAIIINEKFNISDIIEVSNGETYNDINGIYYITDSRLHGDIITAYKAEYGCARDMAEKISKIIGDQDEVVFVSDFFTYIDYMLVDKNTKTLFVQQTQTSTSIGSEIIGTKYFIIDFVNNKVEEGLLTLSEYPSIKSVFKYLVLKKLHNNSKASYF